MKTTKIFYDFEATSVSRDADMISVGLVAVTEKELSRTTNFIEKEAIEIITNEIFHPEKNIKIKTFYAEFTDFNLDKCDDWVKENVVGKLKGYLDLSSNAPDCQMISTTDNISKALKKWLSQFEKIEFWADFDVIDKPMLIDLISDWDYKVRGQERIVQLTEHIGDTRWLCTDFKEECHPCYNIQDLYKTGLPKHLPNIRYDQFFDLHTLFKIKGIDTDINRQDFSEVKQQVIPLPFSDYDKSHNALYDAYVNYLCYQKLCK